MTETYKNKINTFLLLRIFIRSFFIQSGWNFEKMQNLGFIYSIMPALKKIHGDNNDELKSAVKRHLSFFNTHPYFSAPILGATIRLEEYYKNTNTGLENITLFKNSLMGICGGVGDAFFWGGTRPVAGLIGVILALTYNNFYAPLICFLFYNIIHLTFRASTFFLGYYKGISITDTLKKIDLKTKTQKLKYIQAALIGILLALIKNKFVINDINMLSYDIIGLLSLILIVFLLYFLIKRGLSPVFAIYIASIAVILTTYFL